MGSVSQIYQLIMKRMTKEKRVVFVHFALQYILALITVTLFYIFDNKEWKWAYLSLICMVFYQFMWYFSRKLLYTHSKEG